MCKTIEKLKEEFGQDIEDDGGNSMSYKKRARLVFSVMGFTVGVKFKSEFCHLNCVTLCGSFNLFTL